MEDSRNQREEKVKRIFQQFDKNKDGGLNKEEMASLVIAVNPRVKFSEEQINAILDEVFRSYGEFIDVTKGMSFEGLLRTYDDGAGDVDRDFDALNLELPQSSTVTPLDAQDPSPSSTPFINQIVEDLKILIKRLSVKKMKEGKQGENSDGFSDAGWSTELGNSDSGRRKIFWEDLGNDYQKFLKDLEVLRGRLDSENSLEQAFDGHMELGKCLYDNFLLKESSVSFRRACDLRPDDPHPHFRLGNALYSLGKFDVARKEFISSLEATKSNTDQYASLIPQIQVNLGITFECEGMLLNACEHYREAAILCPSHFRALKLLGSALLAVGEYRASEKALEEAIYLKPDYADAHCDLGSALHAMGGEDERAILEFQKAIDLKPGHVEALFNLGGLYMDDKRYQRASEVYTRVLSLCPNNWHAQLNKAVALLGAGEEEEAQNAMKEAFKMTKRIEIYDAISHLKVKKGKRSNGEASFLVVEPSRFKSVGKKTSLRQDLANALEIRSFQRITRLHRCDINVIRKEISRNNTPISYDESGEPQKSIRKSEIEVILQRMLTFLNSEAFQDSIRAINKKILIFLDGSGRERVDIGMFFAIIAPLCGGNLDHRKRAIFEALLSRADNKDGGENIKRNEAERYIRLLRAIYVSTLGISELLEVPREEEVSTVTFPGFLEMFNDPDWGFSIMDTLVKLELNDRLRHGRFTCVVCQYPIIGSRFKEKRAGFNLCTQCYSQGKVPSSCKQEEYTFKEYGGRVKVKRDKCTCFCFNFNRSQENT